MNIVTGAGGFIGRHFVRSLENVLEIDLDNCEEFIEKFNRWDEVDMIIHQGALSSTTNKDLGMIHKYNIDYVHIQGFRYFNVYGSGEYHKGSMASLVSQFQWQSSVGVIHPFEGSDQIYRDYVWVGDLVNVVLSNTAGSGIYDLGTGSPITIDTVAQLVSLKTGCQSTQIPFPPPLKGKYQYYTIADMDWLKDYNFLTVKEYIDRL